MKTLPGLPPVASDLAEDRTPVIPNRRQRRAQAAHARREEKRLTKKFEEKARKLHASVQAEQQKSAEEAAKEYSFE